MRLLNMDQVARILAVPRARAYTLAREGLLPAVYLGRQVRIDEEALREWIARGGRSLADGPKRDPHQETVNHAE